MHFVLFDCNSKPNKIKIFEKTTNTSKKGLYCKAKLRKAVKYSLPLNLLIIN